MDSRLLNVFHEDPYEGNYIKYDTVENFWTNDNDDTMSMELTDTLNGILPIAPIEDTLLKHTEEELQNSKNLLIYNDFVEQQLSDCDVHMLNSQVYHVTEQQRQLSALAMYDQAEFGGDDDAQSQCSNSTFRSRTDSSSIADYESHSSDYDDDEEPKLIADEEISERKGRTISTNTVGSDADGFGLSIDVNNFDLADFITKDDFAMNMKAASGVTPTKPSKSIVVNDVPEVRPLQKSVVVSLKRRDSEGDSDSIIDVETVDVDESLWAASKVPADDLCYVDNVKADPPWCPKQTKKLAAAGNGHIKEHKAIQSESSHHKPAAKPTTAATTTSTSKPKSSNNICLVPNKKQCEFLKRKVGAKTTNNATATTTAIKLAAKKAQEATKTKPTTMSSKKPQEQKPFNAKVNNEVAAATPRVVGIGLGGKNLALIKHERSNVELAATTIVPTTKSVEVVAVEALNVAPKRKLNLEEYKQRRCGVSTNNNVAVPSKQPKLQPCNVTSATNPHIVPEKATNTTAPQNEAITNIVNSLKCPTSQPPQPTDPITVAKNKVLRMLELKRAQQLKIIDSRVSAKVPRVTKLPTLKDIVKDTYCMETTEEEEQTTARVNNKVHTDYEEIIIVSASCNTDITIPPGQHLGAKDSNLTPSSRSLLKSSVLLYNMSMNNSLIASIQSEVVKQTGVNGLSTGTATVPAASKEQDAQHGEDKVIMHLPKDRVRKLMVSIGTQTELQAEFPLLTLPTTHQSRERTRRQYRKRSKASNDSSRSSSSCSSTCSSLSYRCRSNSNSAERLRPTEATLTCSSSVGGGGYSSRSTHRHRSSVSSSSYSEAGKYERQQRRQRRTSYNKRRSKKHTRSTSSTSGSEFSDRSRSPHRQRSRSRSRSRSNSGSRYTNGYNNNNRRAFVDRNVSQPAVEERRIVYVGRIEQETTKEVLRRKFLRYGPIKQITIHYKENGMKYGFVTFERAQDAFTAIDSSAQNSQINMYDISFGGRRAFCRASYADLDNAGINNYHSYVYPKLKAAPVAPQEDSFEAMLLKVKAKLNLAKPTAEATNAAMPAQNSAEYNSNNKSNSDSNNLAENSQI